LQGILCHWHPWALLFMRTPASDVYADPFQERSVPLLRKSIHLLGARVQFESNSRDLMKLVNSAYAGLPRHRMSAAAARLRVRLHLTSEKRFAQGEPPPIEMLSGAGLLGGATQASNLVILSPTESAALVAVSPWMLRFSYHTRYELIEFAVYTLAARVQQLVPFHAACVGLNGRGVLLIGPSGAGKSTVALHCALGGLDFLSEDSVFVSPGTMLATGIANFLHVRADSLRWLGRSEEAAVIRKSPVIRRRSGVEKFEVDLRRPPFRLAGSALEIVGVVFLSARNARRTPLLKPLPRSAVLDTLAITQAYGASHPQWRIFKKNLPRLAAFELRRGRHPSEASEALRSLLS
jgi:hypothetical protein